MASCVSSSALCAASATTRPQPDFLHRFLNASVCGSLLLTISKVEDVECAAFEAFAMAAEWIAHAKRARHAVGWRTEL